MVSAAGGTTTFFHGTSFEFALAFLEGQELDADIAAAAKFDGPPGFFLAERLEDVEFFALRRVRSAIIRFELTAKAMARLRSAGALLRRLPANEDTPGFKGSELFVPPEAFGMFNRLRRSGEIVVSP